MHDKVKVFTLKATIDRRWNKNYANPQTNEYKKLKTDLETALSSELVELPNFLSVKIISFSEGSVKFVFSAFFKNSTNVSEESLIKKIESSQNSLLKGAKVSTFKANETVNSKAVGQLSVTAWLITVIAITKLILFHY